MLLQEFSLREWKRERMMAEKGRTILITNVNTMISDNMRYRMGSRGIMESSRLPGSDLGPFHNDHDEWAVPHNKKY